MRSHGRGARRERSAFIPRIHELQTTLDAERGALVVRLDAGVNGFSDDPQGEAQRAFALNNGALRLVRFMKGRVDVRTISIPRMSAAHVTSSFGEGFPNVHEHSYCRTNLAIKCRDIIWSLRYGGSTADIISETRPTMNRTPVRRPSERLSLATVIEQISGDEGLSKRVKMDRCCALRTYARYLQMSPNQIPVTVEFIRGTLRGLTPAKTSASASRLGRVRAAVGFALEYSRVGEGIRVQPGQLGKPYEELLSTIENRWARVALHRFFAYCTRTRILPFQINSSTLKRYYLHLKISTLASNPRGSAKNAAYFWNHCSRNYAHWPKTTLTFKVRADEPMVLNKAFKREIELYGEFLRRSCRHPVTQSLIARPLQPSTLRKHLESLSRCAQIAQRAGVAIHSLADLLQVETVDMIRRHYLQRRPPLAPSTAIP
jgi:hypothetical protein